MNNYPDWKTSCKHFITMILVYGVSAIIGVLFVFKTIHLGETYGKHWYCKYRSWQGSNKHIPCYYCKMYGKISGEKQNMHKDVYGHYVCDDVDCDGNRGVK